MFNLSYFFYIFCIEAIIFHWKIGTYLNFHWILYAAKNYMLFGCKAGFNMFYTHFIPIFFKHNFYSYLHFAHSLFIFIAKYLNFYFVINKGVIFSFEWWHPWLYFFIDLLLMKYKIIFLFLFNFNAYIYPIFFNKWHRVIK